jgi:hypothetical protein
MTVSTDVPMGLGSFLAIDPISRRQGGARRLKPVMLRVSRTTADWNSDLPEGTALARSGSPQRTFAAPMANASLKHEVRADSTPLQVWEGTVLNVDRAACVMQVLLEAKIGQMPQHTGEIDLDSVSPQDQDLVRPGAVFYLTLYKRTIPSVENIQELRFRRRPSWSPAQLTQVERDASMFLSKMKALPTAA